MQTIQVTRLPATGKKPLRFKAFTEYHTAISSDEREAVQSVCDAHEWLNCEFIRAELPKGGALYVFAKEPKLSFISEFKRFEIREGNGNDGEYRRGYVIARDAFEALRKASRDGMICKPKDVTYGNFEGDNEHCHAVSHVAPIYGDSCRWCASASIAEGE